MARDKGVWQTVTYLEAPALAREARRALDELKFTYDRERSERAFDKLYVLVPMIKTAYVFQFRVREPAEFTIDIFDTQPTQSGVLHNIVIEGLTDRSLPRVKEFVRALAGGMPAKPWKIPFGQKLKYALLASEYLRARDQWRAMGVE